jgi:hypothetical protein
MSGGSFSLTVRRQYHHSLQKREAVGGAVEGMPSGMPTPCLDGVRPASTCEGVIELKLLQSNALYESVYVGMPRAKLLILIIFLVRDQEVGGSNPLAPTNSFNKLQAKTSSFLRAKSTFLGG